MAFRPPSLRQACLVLAAAAALAWLVNSRLPRPASRVVATPAPVARPTTARPLPPELRAARADYRMTLEMLRQGKLPSLTREEVEAFLTSRGRTPGNLLVASRLCKDVTLLREAAQAAPEDPSVQLELALRGEGVTERAAAVEAFRRLSPGNSLGDYLALHVSFEQGDFVAAAGALLGATDNRVLADYSRQITAGTEEAYVSAGYEPVAAKVAAMYALERMPQLEMLRNVGTGLGQLRDELIKVGDFEAAEPTVVAGQALGQRLQEQSPYLLDQMVGMGIEKSFLAQLDPETLIGADGTTVAARIAEIDARRDEVRTLTAGVAEAFAKMDAAQTDQYVEIVRREGELAALRWLKAQAK